MKRLLVLNVNMQAVESIYCYLAMIDACFDEESLLIKKTKLYLPGMSTPSMSLIKTRILQISLTLAVILGIGIKPGIWTNGLACLHFTHMFMVCNFLPNGNNIASKKKIQSDGIHLFTAVKYVLFRGGYKD